MARILIAEDSPDVRALVELLMRGAGHEVRSVADGRTVVSAAREWRPELVLMDLSLPLLSGWEAVRQIRLDPASRSMAIVAVTAHAMHGDRERAMAAGCNGFIAKPIDEGRFAGKVEEFLRSSKQETAAVSEASDPPSNEPARILVVDDQEEVARVIHDDLAADGHDVAIAHAVDQAEILADDEPFELAVVDVMLGDRSGYDLTEALKRRADYLPVLLVTAGMIDREKGFAAGADDFIGKPIESAELRARARTLIRVGRAIRHHRRLGRERSEAYRRLEELDRLKSGFLSTVSHELRTPLNTIILLAHRLEKALTSDRGDRRHRHDVRVLRGAAETLRQMVNNILDLAKLDAGQRDVHPQPTSIPDLLRETADLIEPQAREKGLQLEVEVRPGFPTAVCLDRGKVARVLVNLLSNAVKYTSEGRVILAAAPWEGSVTFSVTDTGDGIPQALIGKAFEPFQQIRTRSGEASRGTGLGLSISKQLVEIMGGDLILESREGEGTTVRFTIPELPPTEIADACAADGAAPGVMPLVEGRRARVLIIEDDEPSRYGLAALLESEGYLVDSAASLNEADARMGAAHSPDVVLLDVTLPDGDGAAWLERRNAQAASTPPVIALTGVTADEDTRRIRSAGVRLVLTKPVNVTQLLLALKDTLDPPKSKLAEG
ncbi:MAG TPA: response regulator [Thermoanaerobaculia bacterium]|nr:response regulator [Thermoanaerobaculia bacterium]